MSNLGDVARGIKDLKRELQLTDKELFKYLHEYLDLLNPEKSWTGTTGRKHVAQCIEGISEKDQIDFKEFHKKIVGEFITFMNGHPDLQNIIKIAGGKYLEGENYRWKKDYIVSISLSIDNIEDSLNCQTWTPSTDSCLEINIDEKVPIILST